MLKKLLFTTFLTLSSGLSLMNKGSFSSPLISNKIPTNDIIDYVVDSEYTAKSVNGKVGFSPAPYYLTYLIKFETNPSYNYNTKGLYLFLDLYNFMTNNDNYYYLLESIALYGDYGRNNYLDETINHGGIIKFSDDMRLIMFNISFLNSFLTNQYLYLDLAFRVDNNLLISDYISNNSSSIAQESNIRPILLYDTYYLMKLYGSSIGYNDGYTDGLQDGYLDGYTDGLDVGYGIGFSDAEYVGDGTWLGNLVFGTIGGIVGFLFALSDFEFLGVSIMSIITLFVAVGIIKLLIGVIK